MRQRFYVSARNESGFSMPEVLVVIMIIGALAAITSPSFVCQKQRASDASSKVVARTAASAMEAYANDNLGAYDGATGSILHSIDSEVPSSTNVTAGTDCPSAVCFVVKSPPNSTTGNTFQLTKTSAGELLSDCSSHGIGGCPSNGKWSAE